ncbi:MAG TPA: hypothetical protein VFG69_19215 [Nannocystaceae bacterium]|nr:hypothetical protein [Nannocystaceae bacterium]
MILPLIAACLSFTLPDAPLVRAAHHEVSSTSADVVVDTTWVLGAMPEPGAVFVLAAPLPRDTTVEGAQPEFGDDGRIAALRLDAPCKRCVLRTTTAWTRVEHDDALPLLVASPVGVHRITLDPDVSFRPAAELGLVTELGFTAPAGFGFSDRAYVDDVLEIAAPRFGAYYLRAEEVAEAGGVVGVVRRREDAHRRTALFAGAVFLALCGAAAWEYRRARKRAELERAEAILEAEYADLDTKDE